MKNQKGFSLVELLVVVIIIAIIAAIAIPNLLASRRAANESTAIADLRTVHTAQATYAATTSTSGSFAPDFATLSGAPNLLDASWTGAPVKNTFTFTMTTASGNAKYCVKAKSNDTNARDFGVDSGGTIYQSAAAVRDLTCAAGLLGGTTTVLGS